MGLKKKGDVHFLKKGENVNGDGAARAFLVSLLHPWHTNQTNCKKVRKKKVMFTLGMKKKTLMTMVTQNLSLFCYSMLAPTNKTNQKKVQNNIHTN